MSQCVLLFPCFYVTMRLLCLCDYVTLCFTVSMIFGVRLCHNAFSRFHPWYEMTCQDPRLFGVVVVSLLIQLNPRA